MYNNIQSETCIIKCGVSQGAILGPLLFIIYMNDICSVSGLLYTIIYADDTSGNDLKILIQSVSSELCLLKPWLNPLRLLNVLKRIKNKSRSYYSTFPNVPGNTTRHSVFSNLL